LSTIDLEFTHSYTTTEAKARLEELFASLRDRSPYFEGVHPEWVEPDRICRFQGEGFSGEVLIDGQNARVKLDLEGMLVMFRPMVDQKLRELIAKHFPENE